MAKFDKNGIRKKWLREQGEKMLGCLNTEKELKKMKKSKETQKFKIGRFSYGFPNQIIKHGKDYYLSCDLINGGKEWRLCYKYSPVYSGNEFILETYAPTFNKALKELHAKLKEVIWMT